MTGQTASTGATPFPDRQPDPGRERRRHQRRLRGQAQRRRQRPGLLDLSRRHRRGSLVRHRARLDRRRVRGRLHRIDQLPHGERDRRHPQRRRRRVRGQAQSERVGAGLLDLPRRDRRRRRRGDSRQREHRCRLHSRWHRLGGASRPRRRVPDDALGGRGEHPGRLRLPRERRRLGAGLLHLPGRRGSRSATGVADRPGRRGLRDGRDRLGRLPTADADPGRARGRRHRRRRLRHQAERRRVGRGLLDVLRRRLARPGQRDRRRLDRRRLHRRHHGGVRQLPADGPDRAGERQPGRRLRQAQPGRVRRRLLDRAGRQRRRSRAPSRSGPAALISWARPTPMPPRRATSRPPRAPSRRSRPAVPRSSSPRWPRRRPRRS